MQNKSLLQIILFWFNKIMVALTKPKTAVDLLKYSSEKANYFNLKSVPTWKALKKIDKIIADFIISSNVATFKGTSIYEIDSCYDLNKAMNLIKYGIAKEQDYVRTDKPNSKIRDFGFNFFDEEMKAFQNNVDLQEIARSASKTQEEYTSLLYDFATYKADLIKYNILIYKMDSTVETSQISEYLQQNLYDITDLRLAKEAMRALNEMFDLIMIGIESFNGTNIKELSLFTLQKINTQYEKNDFTGIVFNQVKRQKYFDQEKEDAQAEARREKRNKQARDRRAKLKAAEAVKKTQKIFPKTAKKYSAKLQKNIPVVTSRFGKAKGGSK